MQAKHSSGRFEMKSDTSLTCSCAAVLIWRNYNVDILRHETSIFAPSVSQVTQDRLQSEPSSPNRASFISEQNKLYTKDLEDVLQTMEETRGASCKPYQIWALFVA
ncbi:hypothetical protein Patl1_15774 [Pistacia atlantica]|uniref:Uncharacterized protein n=1 Tax=Pistacia atlantica TaxID=434234 RepID=A0ACC1B6K7_9ROSI|nr:hypothetical protein Patl1_15774 [Pistacia atlantica]